MMQFLDLVDIFKFSGRLTVPVFAAEDAQYFKAVWYYNDQEKFKQPISKVGHTVYADNYDDIIKNNLSPIHSWSPGWIDTRYTTEDYRTTYTGYKGIWSTAPGKKLEKLLTSCRNQCWDCHECERTFGTEEVDSALQLRKVAQ